MNLQDTATTCKGLGKNHEQIELYQFPCRDRALWAWLWTAANYWLALGFSLSPPCLTAFPWLILFFPPYLHIHNQPAGTLLVPWYFCKVRQYRAAEPEQLQEQWRGRRKASELAPSQLAVKEDCLQDLLGKTCWRLPVPDAFAWGRKSTQTSSQDLD